MTTPSNPSPLIFSDFLSHLSRQGFTIGVYHHLRLHQLLDQIGGECSPQELKTILCPIFATHEAEQALFHHAFDSYFEIFHMSSLANEDADEDSGTTDESAVTKQSIFHQSLTVTISTIIALLFLALVPYLYRRLNPKPPLITSPTPAPTPSIASVSPVPTPAASSSLPTPEPTRPNTAAQSPTPPANNDATPQITPSLATPTPLQTSRLKNFAIAHRSNIRFIGTILPFLFLMLFEIVRLHKRSLILEKARGRKPPFSWPIKIEALKLQHVASDRFYRVVRRLRRRQISEFHRLDISKTVAATIASRGYPTFLYRPDTRFPEYLILIDRHSQMDHQAEYFDVLRRALEKEGLFLLHYFYNRDPRICWSETDNSGIYLTELQKKYPEHRLLIFGDGEKLVDPVSGQLTTWAGILLEWQDRAILTPASPSSWDLREKTLGKGFILLPAQLQGLEELSDRFEFFISAESDHGPPTEPTAAEFSTNSKVDELRTYLGETTFEWLCACSVYTELHWDLTLYLGSLISEDESLLKEKTLLRLISLPWFRSGSIPDELRIALIGKLDPKKQETVRNAIIELLEKSPAPAGTFAAHDRHLDVVIQRLWLNRNQPRELKRTLKEIARFESSEFERDYTLIHFLESATMSPLAIPIPRRIQHLFYRQGIQAFGLRTSVRMLITMVIAALWLGFSALLPSVSDLRPAMLPATMIGSWRRGAEIPAGNVVKFSPDGRLLVAGTYPGFVKLWDTTKWTELTKITPYISPSRWALSADGKALATIKSPFTEVGFWSTETWTEFDTLPTDSCHAYSLALSPDSILALGCENGQVGVYRGRLKIADLRHGDFVTSLAFSRNSKLLASVSVDKVMLWDTNSWQVLRTLTFAPLSNAAFDAELKVLLTISSEGQMQLWDLTTGRQIAVLAETTPNLAIALSPTGQFVAFESHGLLKVWDTSKQQEAASLELQHGDIWDLAFTPDGRAILATGSGYTVILPMG